MAMFFKTQTLENREILSIAAFATFNFSIEEPRLLDEQILWDVAKLNLDKEEALDSGISKHRGEYLIYGSCEVSKPVSGVVVYANVAGLSKALVVIGDRSYTRFGITDPKPFTSLAINYRNAFGGDGFSNNPMGKGFARNGEQVELPNIENPHDLITKKSDKPDPVGFTAYPQMWPQRLQYFGQITSDYLNNDWPGFPDGTNPEYFNVAPMDQRLNAFFVGNESFSIKNMNAKNPNQSSVLPGLRARIFVMQNTNNNEEVFKELISRAETLFLFPNQEVGSLLYRSSVEVVDEEYSDINKLYAVWEDNNQAPKSIDYYYNQMMNEINPPQEELLAVSEMPEQTNITKVEKVVQESTIIDPPQVSIRDTDPEITKALKQLEDMNAKMLDDLRHKNIDIEQSKLKLMPKPDPTINTTDVKEILEQLEQKNAELIKKFNISPEDAAKVLAKANGSPEMPLVSDLFGKLSKAGGKSEELAANIQELTKHIEKLKLEIPQNAEVEIEAAAKDTPNEKHETPEQKPILRAFDHTREDVIRQYNINKNLSNLDLSNLDLSNLNLTNANFGFSILENTNFKESILNNSLFHNSRANGANFTKSSLVSSKFEDVIASEAIFDNAILNDAHFINSDFTNCNFSNVSLNKAFIVQTSFEGSGFENAMAQELNAKKVSFVGSNLTKANFANSVLLESDLSNTIITNTNFAGLNAPQLKLGGAVGSSANFINANLQSSRADSDTVLDKSNFKSVNIVDSSWEGAKLSESDFSLAVMDDSNFSGVVFNKSCLELAVAKNTNFSKASFTDSDLNRINLFKGSLRGANIVGADLRYSNLYGVDFYKAKVGNTKLKGANLHQTLFDVLGGDVEKI